jgi:hypothetical protein
MIQPATAASKAIKADVEQNCHRAARSCGADEFGARDRDVALPFGKQGEQPYNVAAKDVPLTHLIFRTRDLNPTPTPGEAPPPKVQAVVDHVAYTVADFDREKAKAELKGTEVAWCGKRPRRRPLQPPHDRPVRLRRADQRVGQ